MKKILWILLLITTLVTGQTNPTSFVKIKVTDAAKNNDATRIVVQDSLTKEYRWMLKSNFFQNTYGFTPANDANVVKLTGNQTIAGNKTFQGQTTLRETIISDGYWLKFPKSYYTSSITSNVLTGDRTIAFPDATGTIALTSNLSAYVPTSGYSFGTTFSLGTMAVSTGFQPTVTSLLGAYSNGYTYQFGAPAVQSFLGLGSNAYTSTTYLTPTGSAANLTSFPTLNQNTTGISKGLLGTSEFLVHPNTNTLRFTGQVSNGTSGLFPSVDNSNAIINLNRHDGEYNSQLGFSSNGNMYYRSFSATAMNTTQPWKTILDSGNYSSFSTPLTGGTGYIQNQNSSAQSANMWINGTGQFGSTLTVGGSTVLGGSSLTVNSTAWGMYQSVGTANNYFAGNVGINTSSPIHKLSIDGKIGGNIYSGSYLEFLSNGNTKLTANNDVVIGYNQNTIVKQDGKVGILTNTPTEELDVTGNIQSSADSKFNGVTVGKGGGNIASNTVVGNGAGFSNINAVNSTFIGKNAGYNITDGDNQVAIGEEALYLSKTIYKLTLTGYVDSCADHNDNDYYSVDIGNGVLVDLTIWDGTVDYIYLPNPTSFSNLNFTGYIPTSLIGGSCDIAVTIQSNTGIGYGNIAIGNKSLRSGLSPFNNVAVGNNALYNSNNGNNTAIGNNALYNFVDGGSTVAIGDNAGRYTGPSGALTYANNSIFIGKDSRALSDWNSNEIVIGAYGVGLGYGSTVIGNSSTSKTRIKGRLLLGTDVDNGSDAVQINASNTGGIKVIGRTGGGGYGAYVFINPATLTNSSYWGMYGSGNVNGYNTKISLGVTQGTSNLNGVTVPTPELGLAQANKYNVLIMACKATEGASQINSRLQVGYDQWQPDNANTATLSVGGTVKATSLAGTGTRTVVADANGLLSTTATVDSRPYKVYTARISQSGSNAPTANIVLENNLGAAVTYTYVGGGNYLISSSAFTLDKVACFYQKSSVPVGVSGYKDYEISQSSAGNVLLVTRYNTGVSNDLINNDTIEIRVYN